MEILNPKVGTVPKKIRVVFMVNKSPRALFSVIENRVCFGRRFKPIIKFTKQTVGAGKSFKIMLKKLHFFYICIKLFRTQLKMAKQTNFVKLSIMQIKILSLWLGKPILLYEIKRQSTVYTFLSYSLRQNSKLKS